MTCDDRFLRRRLLLDFRLAEVRYAAGIPPVDDTYYQRPQDLSAVPARPAADLPDRLRRGRSAARAAMAAAQECDRAYRTDRHCAFVADRRTRLQAIAEACGLDLDTV